MEMFMSQPPFFGSGSEVSTKLSRFVSDSRVVQIKSKKGRITGSANRLSSVFPGRKQDGRTSTTHTHTHSLLDDVKWAEAILHIVLTGTLNQHQMHSNFTPHL